MSALVQAMVSATCMARPDDHGWTGVDRVQQLQSHPTAAPFVTDRLARHAVDSACSAVWLTPQATRSPRTQVCITLARSPLRRTRAKSARWPTASSPRS